MNTSELLSTSALAAQPTWVLILDLAICVLYVVEMWKIFVKAGEPGWKAIIPFYNLYTTCKITLGNGLWFLLFFAPIASVFIPFKIVGIIAIAICAILNLMISIAMAKSFGKGIGFGIGIFILSVILLGVLAFGDSKYIGPWKKNEEVVPAT